jgi:twitching motility two-component system response regulator PilH
MARILIVEDDKTSRFLLEKILSAHGYDVLKASCAKEALDLLKEGQRPDLIISDVMMPNMTGIEMARKIRENPEIKDIPIMLCTAVHEKETVIEAVKLGIHHYLVKPLDAEKLIRQIEDILPEDGPTQDNDVEEKQSALQETVESRKADV